MCRCAFIFLLKQLFPVITLNSEMVPLCMCRFTDLMKKLKKNIDDAVIQLMNNFETEFGSEHISQERWNHTRKPIPGLEDEEVSSFHSMFEQVGGWLAS